MASACQFNFLMRLFKFNTVALSIILVALFALAEPAAAAVGYGGATAVSTIQNFIPIFATSTRQAVDARIIELTNLDSSKKHIFNFNLKRGAIGSEVVYLQQRLKTEGFFIYPVVTGYFGPVTFSAVEAYQRAHPEIGYVTGFVGPLTREALNK